MFATLSELILFLLYNIVNMLVVTLIIACLTLIERKLLSLLQRRVGPYFVGYKGRLQYIADALKMFIKGVIIVDEINKLLFTLIPAIVLGICYTLWVNIMWGPHLSIFELEYNVVFAALLSLLFSIGILLTGFFSKNKYAVLASLRTGLLTLNLELFMGLFFINICLISEGFNLLIFSILQEIYNLIYLFSGLCGLIIVTYLLEVNRAPFDLSEAESEIVSGYHVEYGGFFFGLYYLGEYLHLYFFSALISIFLLGGWDIHLGFITEMYNLPIF